MCQNSGDPGKVNMGLGQSLITTPMAFPGTPPGQWKGYWNWMLETSSKEQLIINSLLIGAVFTRLIPNSSGMLGYTRSMVMGDLGNNSSKIRVTAVKPILPACQAQICVIA